MKNGILILCASLLLGSCAKEGPTGPTGPVGPSLPGSISGHVKLFDMYGSQVLTGLGHVNLYLGSSSTGINPDSAGYYQFTKVGTVPMTTGIYTISASDSAYGATVKGNIQLVTGALNVDIKLSAIPDSFVYTFRALHNTGAATDSLALTFKPDTRTRYCIVFAGSTADVGNLSASYLWSKVLSISPTAPFVSYQVPAQDLTDAGLVSGSKVYFAAYSYVVGDVSVYEDFATGKNVYNAVSGRLVDSTYVP